MRFLVSAGINNSAACAHVSVCVREWNVGCYCSEVGSDDAVSKARLPLQLAAAVFSMVELAEHFLQLHHLHNHNAAPVSICLPKPIPPSPTFPLKSSFPGGHGLASSSSVLFVRQFQNKTSVSYYNCIYSFFAFTALTLLVGHQKEQPACKN